MVPCGRRQIAVELLDILAHDLNFNFKTAGTSVLKLSTDVHPDILYRLDTRSGAHFLVKPLMQLLFDKPPNVLDYRVENEQRG